MNWQIALCAVTFFLLENNYFGWNRLPQSDGEVLADGVVMLLTALVFLQYGL